MKTQEDCTFCKIIAGKIPAIKIFEDERYFIMLDNNPINPGHTLVIPKNHIAYIFDMGNKETKKGGSCNRRFCNSTCSYPSDSFE